MPAAPEVVAQAAATSQLLLEGRFTLGVGSDENLNEHILGDHWAPANTRLEMLEEAVGVIRELWKGKTVSHHGAHYTVENARLYSCPDTPPPIAVSACGDRSLELAARLGDGLVTVSPDAAMVRGYRDRGGTGPVLGAVKVCWDTDESRARKLAHEVYVNQIGPDQRGFFEFYEKELKPRLAG